MTFTTPQADIDRMLAVEASVKPHERALYLECMNGIPLSERVAKYINNIPLSERIANPAKDVEFAGRDIRDGCILTGVFIRCRNP